MIRSGRRFPRRVWTPLALCVLSEYVAAGPGFITQQQKEPTQAAFCAGLGANHLRGSCLVYLEFADNFTIGGDETLPITRAGLLSVGVG